MIKKMRLLCVVYEPANFAVWLKLANRAKCSGDFDVVIWSPYSLPDSEQYKIEALTAGSVYVEETTSAGALSDIFTPLSGWLSPDPIRLPRGMIANPAELSISLDSDGPPSYAMEFAAELTNDECYQLCCEVDRIRRRISFCEDWLVRLGIGAVVLAEDNVERDSYAWVEAARRRRAKSIVISYGAISDQEAIIAYKNSASHSVEEDRVKLIKKYMPHWLAEGSNFSITRIPFIDALARELTNTAPFNPWIVNTGNVDEIILESPAMKQVYLEHGFAGEKLKPIGHPLQDRLADISRQRTERRIEILANHQLKDDRPLAIVAMPPDQFSTRDACYSNYEQIIDAFACMPRDLAGFNVIASPHPNLSKEKIAMIRDTGVALEELPVSELLPLADIYIACVSSTIKWALGFGIPIIDFDCYGYRYSTYSETSQVISVESDNEYKKALSVLADIGKLRGLIESARENSAYWGGIDGMALDRILKIIFEA